MPCLTLGALKQSVIRRKKNVGACGFCARQVQGIFGAKSHRLQLFSASHDCVLYQNPAACIVGKQSHSSPPFFVRHLVNLELDDLASKQKPLTSPAARKDQ